MFVIRHKKLFLGISLAVMTAALGCIVFFGLRPGIDFTGGSALVLTYESERPPLLFAEEAIENAGFVGSLVQPVGDQSFSVKTRVLSDREREALVSALTDGGLLAARQESFTTIGPSVGEELKQKAIISIVLVLVAIIFFVAYVFRKVSYPVSSWKYGIAVIAALFHDILIPTGFFAVMGHIVGAQIDTLFIVALLTTLALSISDTIVVFDRVREMLSLKNEQGNFINKDRPFEEVVGESLSQTFARSINTSLMSLVSVLALAIVGPKSTQLFAIVLAIGMFFGIYSSIFMASPLLVLLGKKGSKDSHMAR